MWQISYNKAESNNNSSITYVQEKKKKSEKMKAMTYNENKYNFVLSHTMFEVNWSWCCNAHTDYSILVKKGSRSNHYKTYYVKKRKNVRLCFCIFKHMREWKKIRWYRSVVSMKLYVWVYISIYLFDSPYNVHMQLFIRVSVRSV